MVNGKGAGILIVGDPGAEGLVPKSGGTTGGAACVVTDCGDQQAPKEKGENSDDDDASGGELGADLLSPVNDIVMDGSGSACGCAGVIGVMETEDELTEVMCCR